MVVQTGRQIVLLAASGQPSTAAGVKARNEDTMDRETTMKLSNNRLPGGVKTRTAWIWAALILSAMILTACGGDGGSGSEQSPVPTAVTCNPADPTTTSECGTLLIGITDAAHTRCEAWLVTPKSASPVS